MKTLVSSIFLLFTLSTAFSQGTHIRTESRIDQAVSQFNVDGEDVLVIIMDRGIDYRHPDFIDANGNTRIEYIYDLVDNSGANDPNNPYGAGTIYDKASIDQSLANGGFPVLSIDRHGHGTATTGIAAGNGTAVSGGGDAFIGVAPKARIIAIKITHDPFPAFGSQPGQAGFFDPNLLPKAFDFAKDKINELGLPSVTLMNIGSIGGPTDGTSLISREIDDYVNAGNTFVCGVGDDGGADNHATGTIGAGQTIELLVNKGETGFLRLDLWYEEDDRFTVSVERPNGQVEGPFAAPTGPNATADQSLSGIFIGHRGANVEFFQATSNRRELLIDFSGATGIYKVKLEGTTIGGSGEFHATLNPSTFFNDNKFTSFVDRSTSINDYTSAEMAITPGDYVAQNTWTDINGNNRGITGQGNVGELWLGSSLGPTQDGRQGIDFVTPGEVTFAAYFPNTYYHSFTFNRVKDGAGFYGIQNAVSGAAPVATGIIALMLDANSNLSPTEIKDILINSCRTDAFTGAVPNNAWGYGKLDAFLAIQSAANALSNENAIDIGLEVYPNPFEDFIDISSKKGKIDYLRICDQLGRLQLEEDQASNRVDLSRLPAGVYILEAEVRGQKHFEKIVKRRK